MPEILIRIVTSYVADFRALHPGIRVHIYCDNLYVNLTKRIADVAVRLQDSPPEHLVFTHEDLRTTPRFRIFLDFMAERLTMGQPH